MNFHMGPQSLCRGRGKSALVAVVSFFSWVSFEMLPQSACLKRYIIALITFVGFFSSVDPKMCFQSICPGRGKVTMVAFVQFSIWLGFWICPQSIVQNFRSRCVHFGDNFLTVLSLDSNPWQIWLLLSIISLIILLINGHKTIRHETIWCHIPTKSSNQTCQKCRISTERQRQLFWFKNPAAKRNIYCLFVHILVFLQLCFIILKICANMTYYSGISKYASDENVWGHFPLIKSLHIFWYLAMTIELTGTVEKKHPVLQLLLHIVFWMLPLQFRTVSLDHFYYCVQSSHPLLWWRRRRRLFMGGNIAHISHNRWWCTFFRAGVLFSIENA